MNSYPKLIISSSCGEYLHNLAMGGMKVFTLSESVEDDLLSLMYYRSDNVIAVGDISVSAKVSQQLLKFVEGVKFNLICVSSTDCFDAVLLSRFMVVEKHTKLTANRMNSFDSLGKVIRDEGSYHEVVATCPGYLPIYMMYRRSGLPVKAKLFSNV